MLGVVGCPKSHTYGGCPEPVGLLMLFAGRRRGEGPGRTGFSPEIGGRMEFDPVLWVMALLSAGPFALAVTAGAIVSICRSHFSGPRTAGWILLVVLLPLLGPACWFGRHLLQRLPSGVARTPG